MTVWYLVASVGLLVANGFFVAGEFALIAVRRSRIEQLSKAGNSRARTARKSLRELSFMLAGVQLGITMASLGLGALAEPVVARLIESGLHVFGEIPDRVLHLVSFVVALTIVVFLHMVIGEMAPKNIAIAQPEASALTLALPLRIYVNAFRPFISLSNAVANRGIKMFGIDPQDELIAMHTAEEIRGVINESAEGGALDKFEHRLLSGAIVLGERDARSVMVPRTEMTAVPATATPAAVEIALLESGHSRIPVFEGGLDNVVGFLHAKDLLGLDSSTRTRPIDRSLLRQMLMVPDSRKLHPLLFDMRRERKHFGLVIDEHGGTAGVVTIEDVLEELVGEIEDEHDVGELRVERLSDDRYLIPGSYRVEEAVERLGISLPAGEYETVAGFFMARLGRIPKRRDTIEHGDWRFRIRTMQGRKVLQVLAEKTSSTS